MNEYKQTELYKEAAKIHAKMDEKRARQKEQKEKEDAIQVEKNKADHYKYHLDYIKNLVGEKYWEMLLPALDQENFNHPSNRSEWYYFDLSQYGLCPIHVHSLLRSQNLNMHDISYHVIYGYWSWSEGTPHIVWNAESKDADYDTIQEALDFAFTRYEYLMHNDAAAPGKKKEEPKKITVSGIELANRIVEECANSESKSSWTELLPVANSIYLQDMAASLDAILTQLQISSVS